MLFAPPQMRFPLLLDFLCSPSSCSPELKSSSSKIPSNFSPSPNFLSFLLSPKTAVDSLTHALMLGRGQLQLVSLCLLECKWTAGRWPGPVFLWHPPWCWTQFPSEGGASRRPTLSGATTGPGYRVGGRMGTGVLGEVRHIHAVSTSKDTHLHCQEKSVGYACVLFLATATQALPSHPPYRHRAALFPFKCDNSACHQLKEGEGQPYLLLFSTWLSTLVLSLSRSELSNTVATSNR